MARREFQFSEGNSNKFWAVSVEGKSFTVNYGKVGTSGQSQEKSFATEAEAKTQVDKLILEKTKKGYVEVGSAVATAPKSVTVTAGSVPPPKLAPPAQVASAKKPQDDEEEDEDQEDDVHDDDEAEEEDSHEEQVDDGEDKQGLIAPAATANVAAKSSTISKREFHFSEGSSNKFWSIALESKSFTVNYGKVGTSGQSQEKSFATEAEAKTQYDKLVLEKTKKGYVEVP